MHGKALKPPTLTTMSFSRVRRLKQGKAAPGPPVQLGQEHYQEQHFFQAGTFREQGCMETMQGNTRKQTKTSREEAVFRGTKRRCLPLVSSSIETTRCTPSYGPPAPKQSRLVSKRSTSSLPGRSNSPLCEKLGKSGRQQVGSGSLHRLQADLLCSAKSVSPASHKSTGVSSIWTTS